ncbi:MAG TPA: hypothetical protein VNJ51_09675 [Candidatus Dormibacteraeota bacterium]|nr:hypothetical protein [Candidatus Dormibacteraeota bacterium]
MVNTFRAARAALAAASLAFIASPLAASAQEPPSYAQPGVPSYASQDEQIHGRIISFDGGYHLQVRDDRGYVDNVELHQGTVINPTGLTLAPGMVVSINGYNAGPYFAANEIDTPYVFYGAVPYYVGHPWYYYGSSVSLSFFFGNTGWWHGAYYAHPIRVYRGVRVYERPVGVYRGGEWHGRDYVAPRERGGYYPGRDRRRPDDRHDRRHH